MICRVPLLSLFFLSACSTQRIDICTTQPPRTAYQNVDGETATITHEPDTQGHSQMKFSIGDDEMIGAAFLKYSISKSGYFRDGFMFIPSDIRRLSRWKKKGLSCAKTSSSDIGVEFRCQDSLSPGHSMLFTYEYNRGITSFTAFFDSLPRDDPNAKFVLISPVGIGAPCAPGQSGLR